MALRGRTKETKRTVHKLQTKEKQSNPVSFPQQGKSKCEAESTKHNYKTTDRTKRVKSGLGSLVVSALGF